MPAGAGAVAIVAQPLDAIHRAIEAARIDLRRRHQAALDHRDPLSDLELAHARLRQRLDDDVDERADDYRNRYEKRAQHEHIIHARLQRTDSNRLDWPPS